MEQEGIQLNHDRFSCSICLDLLTDPVTIPCGHSYCMNCIKTHWDGEDKKNIHSCPQCRQTFRPRPVLVKNTMLADLVEELKKTGLQAPPPAAAADHCYAGPGDVSCDFCTDRKLKAVKSCLQCLVSYCHKHLQPHFTSPAFKKHKLVEPSEKLQENMCSRHNEGLKMFCRTDQQCICCVCSVDEHKGHDTVTSAAGRSEKQKELEVSRQKIQQRIKDKHRDMKVLQQEVEAISRSADEAEEESDEILTEMIRLIEERRHDVKQQIRSKEETEVIRVKELESKLEQEVTELRRKDAEMDKLSHTHDHNQFLLQYPSVSKLSEDPDSASVNSCPPNYFEDVTTAVSELRDKLLEDLRAGRTNTSVTMTEAKVLLREAPPEPQSRAEFLEYSRDITLDPNTVSPWMALSKGNRRATVMFDQQDHPEHPDRFTMCSVLSKEGLTGRCYWEVKYKGKSGGHGSITVAVTYKDIQRKGGCDKCQFGSNDKSWSIFCTKSDYHFCHNKCVFFRTGPVSSRIGVYLDHTAGVLCFYSVSETMTLLQRVQTTFTEPLYAGLMLCTTGATADVK